MKASETILGVSEKYANKPFLVDGVSGKEFTFETFREQSFSTAVFLKELGLQKGDRVAIVLNNSTTFARLYFGCLYLGVVVVPINPILSSEETSFIVENSNSKALFLSKETYTESLTSLCRRLSIECIYLLDGRAVSSSFEIEKDIVTKSLDDLPKARSFSPFDGHRPEDVCAVVYTSGTTASPTGVVHRLENLVGNAQVFNERLGIDPSNRFYGILAMAYLGGYYNLLLLPYVAGSSVVLSHAFDARSALDFWTLAKKHDVNTLWLVPTILSILLELDRGETGESFCREAIKLALVGTAPLPLGLQKKFEKRYGLNLYENYGLSETLFISANAPSLPRCESSVGRIIPGVEVTITDDKGLGVGYGEEGEIRVRTPWLMSGYDQNEAPSVGWFPTGDVGSLLPSGELFITGRKKDLIIRGGVNISPASIEAVFHKHESIIECAVIGIPHNIYGEEVCAIVKLRAGFAFSDVKEDLQDLCKERLGRVKQPSRILEIENFPKSTTGKIHKARLRALISEKLGVKSTSTSSQEKPKLSIPSRVREKISRVPEDWMVRMSKFPSSIISDSMNRFGVMGSALCPMHSKADFCGSAFTVEEVEAGNLMSHLALTMLQPGDVIVIDAKGVQTRAAWGGLQSKMAKQKGAVGIVVNGAVRDVEEAFEIEMPLFAKGRSPSGPTKGWGGNINFPISCAGAVVRPGDLVRGDGDGVVVVPKELIEEVAECCEKRISLEEGWFQDVAQGKSTVETVGLEAAIKKLNCRFY